MTRPSRQYEARAAHLLPAAVLDYYAGGSGEEITLDAAVAAWRRIRLRPHALVDVAHVDTGIELFGRRIASPVLVAPSAWHGLAHPDGERATARGVRAAGSLLTLSTRASCEYESVAAELAGDPWWFQVYVTRDRSVIEGAVARAVQSGATALVLTGDTPFVAAKRRSAAVPIDHAAELVNLGRHVRAGADPRTAIDQDPSVTERDIEWLHRISGLPVLVKGVLRGDDAQRLVSAGAAGIVVSNHGGRQLDRAIASADALPEVAAAVAGRVPLLVDGGIRSGTDVLAALASGATAVLVGRPVLWALAVDGADGVRTLLTDLADELARDMALAGVTSAAGVEAGLLAR